MPSVKLVNGTQRTAAKPFSSSALAADAPDIAQVVYDAPRWLDDVKSTLIAQRPLAIVVRGRKAKMIYDALRQRGARSETHGLSTAQVVGVDDAIIIGLVIAVIAAVVIGLGLLIFGGIIFEAMNRGYEVKDTKYKAATGQGETRQEHEMVFNLIPPPPET